MTGGQAATRGRVIDRLEIDTHAFTFTARAAGPADGRRVLLLHGFPQTSWCWRAQLSALGDAGYRAVAPDQRGYCAGARPPAVADYAVDHLVGDVIALADAMEMDTFDLVGHDWGGLLSWVVAARHPDRVRSLTVASTPHPLALRHALMGGDPKQARRSRDTDAFRRPAEPERLLLGEDGTGSGLRDLLAEAGLAEADAREYVSVLTEPGALEAALNWFRAMGDGGLGDLPLVKVPTLYVWSSGDAFLGKSAAEASANFVAGPYQFVVLDGVSHWIPEMAPEELSRLLIAHLAST